MGARDYWDRMLVYFGIAEEAYEDEPDEFEGDRPGPGRRSSAAARERDPYADEPAHQRARAGSARTGRPRPGAPRPRTSPPSQNAGGVGVVPPRTFNDAQQIADQFKRGLPVIVNLQATDAALAKRLIDFASGLTYGLDGAHAEHRRQGLPAHAAGRRRQRGGSCRDARERLLQPELSGDVSPAPGRGQEVEVTDLRIGLIGSGNMAGAMVTGWTRDDPSIAARIHLTDRGSGRATALAEAIGGATVHASNRELVAAVDVVLLCVKPIDIEDVLREVSEVVEPRHVVASVAAGVQTATMENLLDDRVAVLRFMPNVPVKVNSGTLVFARGRVGSEQADRTLELFSRLGTTVELQERLFDAATAVSGSGPAFFGLVVEAFEDAAIVSGLSAAVGRELAVTTMVGTAQMLTIEGLSCSDLRRMVTSPGGTAAAGLAQMERSSVRGAIIDAVVAARDRARELG